MRGKDGVYQRRLSQTCLTCVFDASEGGEGKRSEEPRTDDDDVELETTFQEFMLNLLSDGVETDIGICSDFL